MRTKLKGRLSLLFLSFAVMLALPAVALADNLKNDVQNTVGVGQIRAYTAGDPATSVGYYVDAAGGCDAADGSAATVTLSVTSFPSGAAASDVTINYGLDANSNPKTSLTFTQCDVKQSASFSTAANATPGDYEITAAVSDTSGNYNTSPATFKLRVSAPASSGGGGGGGSTEDDCPNGDFSGSTTDGTCGTDPNNGGGGGGTPPANQPPVAEANGPYSVDEGSSVTLSSAGSSDPEGATLTYAWDLDNDGQYDDSTNASPSFSAANLDGPSSHTVGLQVSDGSLTATDTATVNVLNVAPTATFNSPLAAINEGSSFSLSLTNVQDPGSADTFTFAFDCGLGAGYGALGASSSANCSTNDNGTLTVKGTVQDDDGGSSEYTAKVNVLNVAPTATKAFDTSVNEGGSNFTLALTDPDDVSSADEAAGFTYAFDCGNGYGSFGTDSSATCTGPDDGPSGGPLSVGARIKDKDGDFSTYTGSVTVNNLPPSIQSISSSPNALTNTSVRFTGAATDPSTADTLAGFFWQWALDGGAFSGYGAQGVNYYDAKFSSCGTHTVSAQAKDKDGGESAVFPSANDAPVSVSVYDGSFRPPIDTPATNLTLKGKVLPVKITVGCGGQALTGLTPSIKLLNGNVTPGTEGPGDVVEAYSSSAADNTGWMRPVDGGYIYNLQVPGGASVAVGQEFSIRVNPFATAANPNPQGGAMYALLKIKKG